MTPDVTSPEFKAGAYGIYQEWRRREPVKPVRLPDGQTIWLVTRYDDVDAVLKDERFFKDKRKLRARRGASRVLSFFPGLEALERNMLDVDAPDHRRLRAIVHSVFTPRRVEALSSRIEELADALITKGVASGGMDLVADYAYPIPSTIIAEMLGIEARDRVTFQRWTAAIVAGSASPSPWRLLPTMFRFLRYLRRVVRDKQREPGDDIVSALLRAEAQSERLTAEEVRAMVLLLIVAGHETTANLIGNGALALFEHPEAYDRIRSDPELSAGAVEEMLRFYSPVEVATERYASEATPLGGVTIPKHGFVGAVLASANRDEGHFAEASSFDMDRAPNRHLAFGSGAHFCLGAPLARLEARIAFETLAGAARMRPEPTPVRWRRGLNLRGLESLPIRFDG